MVLLRHDTVGTATAWRASPLTRAILTTTLVAVVAASALLLFAGRSSASSAAQTAYRGHAGAWERVDEAAAAQAMAGLPSTLMAPTHAGCSGVLVSRGVQSVHGANGSFAIIKITPDGMRHASLPLSLGTLHSTIWQGLQLGEYLQCIGNKYEFGTTRPMPRWQWQPRQLVANPVVGSRPDACTLRGRTDVLVVGSSVARGIEHDETGVTSPCGGPGGDLIPNLSHKCGWAGHLGEALSSRFGLCMQTEAFSGSTVRATAWLLPAVLRRHRPRAVVIGLSPANDGLQLTGRTEDAEALGDGYLANLRSLAQYAADFPGVELVVVGGPYPNGHVGGRGFTAFHTDVIHRVRDTMVYAWPHPVIDFLATTEDQNKTGRWMDGLSDPTRNGAHPNAHGYERMFHAVDLDVFAHLGQPHGSHDRTWVHAMAERERWRQPWLAELKRQAEHEASFVQ